MTRGLRGTLAAVAQQTRPARGVAVEADDVKRARAAADALATRARQCAGADIEQRITALAEGALEELETAVDQQLAWGRAGNAGVQFLRPLENPPPEGTASWPILTSLRSVDADAGVRIEEGWLPAPAVPITSTEAEEEW